ncbi:MAG: hypothetical protein ACYDCJ_07875 [Gammaproteobacteria bacterium]
MAANRYGTAEFTEGLELLKKSALAGFTEAQVTLGHVHAQVHLLPNAFQEAARWCQRAADQGHPMAQDRLADLCMLGLEYRKTMRRRLTGMRAPLCGNSRWAEFAWIM